MGPIVHLRRAAYRIAYRALQLVWLVWPARLDGVKCLVCDGDLVLLVRHTYGHRLWDLPGGRPHHGEPPLHCARREMQEELGLADADWEPVGPVVVNLQRRPATLHIFRTEVSRPPVRLDLGELSEARWFARAELPADLAAHVIPALARTTVYRRSR